MLKTQHCAPGEDRTRNLAIKGSTLSQLSLCIAFAMYHQLSETDSYMCFYVLKKYIRASSDLLLNIYHSLGVSLYSEYVTSANRE